MKLSENKENEKPLLAAPSTARIKGNRDMEKKNPKVNKTNDLILNLTPENVTQHSRIVTTTCKGSSTPTKMSKIIGRPIH